MEELITRSRAHSLLYSPLTRALPSLIAYRVYWEPEGFDMARSRTTLKGLADEKTATSFFTVFNVSKADIGMFNCIANNRLVTSSASKGAMLVVNCELLAPIPSYLGIHQCDYGCCCCCCCSSLCIVVILLSDAPQLPVDCSVLPSHLFF